MELLPLSEARKRLNVNRSVLDRLAAKGLIKIQGFHEGSALFSLAEVAEAVPRYARPKPSPVDAALSAYNNAIEVHLGMTEDNGYRCGGDCPELRGKRCPLYQKMVMPFARRWHRALRDAVKEKG